MNFKRNQYYRKVLILIILLLLNPDFLIAQDKNPQEILFIGSSYFNYNDLPFIVEKLTEETGKEVYIDHTGQNGMYLEDHVNRSTTEAKINERDWDFIILQGVGSLIAYPDYYTHHPVYPALVQLKNKIHSNNVSTRIIFCLPWAFEDGMTWVQGWTDTYEDMQIEIYNRTLQYSEELDLTIAPVGWAWYKILDDKNYPLHYLHISDWNHPSVKGSYIMACVIYSTLFIESSVGIPYYSGIETSEAIEFQTTASNTVLNDTILWNITTYTDSALTGIIEYEMQHTSDISQNSPNPFYSITHIKYELLKESFVEIKVYDLLGKEYAILVKEKKIPGSYIVDFDGSELKSGIYFYSLRTGENYQVKKMQIIN